MGASPDDSPRFTCAASKVDRSLCRDSRWGVRAVASEFSSLAAFEPSRIDSTNVCSIQKDANRAIQLLGRPTVGLRTRVSAEYLAASHQRDDTAKRASHAEYETLPIQETGYVLDVPDVSQREYSDSE